MKKNKKLFSYQNRIILKNGSSIEIFSIKFLKNYQLTTKITKEQFDKKNISSTITENIFLKKYLGI